MATRRPKMPRAQHADGAELGHAGTADENDASTTSATSPPRAGRGKGKAEGAADRAAARNAGGKYWRFRGRKSAPAASATAGLDEDAGQVPVPARAFSGRLLALAVVLVTITVLLAPAVHTFLQQRAEISALKADIAARQKTESDLTTQLGRWNDPAYVKQQARERINMMMPGETGYWVYNGAGGSATPEKSGSGSGSGNSSNSGAESSGTNLPWVDGLWESIKRSAAP
jgi:cell division protein FtsB